jgi:hypothetical protein
MNKLNTENINGLVNINANNLATANFDADNQGNIYGTNLYINNQAIIFSNYITSSYLSTTLSNYITSSFLTSQLLNYVTNSSLTITLQNYASINALSSYRLISDSWSKSDTDNEIIIRVGNCGTNTDGSITTAKQYIDNATAGLSATIAVNAAVSTGLVASVATINSTLTVIEGEIATLQGEVSTIQTDVSTLQNKTIYQTSNAATLTTNFSNNLSVGNNLSVNNTLTCNSQINGSGSLNLSNTQDHILSGNSITLSQTGKNTQIYGSLYAGAVGSIISLYGNSVNINNTNSITNLTTTTVGGLFQTVNLNGAVYVNGFPLQVFTYGSSGGQWSFPNT